MTNPLQLKADQLALLLIKKLPAAYAMVDHQAVPYGHQVALTEHGQPIGHIHVYAGKKGPRLSLHALKAGPPVVAILDQAWRELLNPVQSSSAGVDLWVDGSCIHNGDVFQFGYAFLVLEHGQELHRESGTLLYEDSASLGSIRERMAAQGSDIGLPYSVLIMRQVGGEVAATLRGLAWCEAYDKPIVRIHHDFEGLSAWPTGRWKASTRFTQYYQQVINSYQACGMTLSWYHEKAHSGIADNELVNRLAIDAARKSPGVTLPPVPESVSR